MQISAIKNNFISNYPKQSYENQGMTSPVNRAELPSFADAKSFVNITFKGEQELMRAIGNHYTDDFDRELATVEDINYQDSEGDTPLTYAAKKNSLDFVEKLLAHPDIDVNIKNNGGRTALFIAAIDGDKDVVAKLLEHPDTDPNCQTKKGNYPLTHCSYSGLTSIVELLITHPDIDVNIKDKDGDTPLHNATLKAHWDVVKKLIEHPDTDVNIRNANGQTALMFAVKNGAKGCTEEILKHPDVDIYAEDNNGRTAFNYISLDAANFRNMLNNYQRGVDKRENVLIATKNIPVDIDKLSPEENVWTEAQITDKFLTLVKTQKLEDAEKMLNSTPCIDLARNDNEILNAVCTTGDFRFVKKVFEYEKNQPEMRADYDAKRKDFLDNKIKALSYEELKENPVATHTEDGFRVLMSKKEFDPNDIVDKRSLFEMACSMNSDGSVIKDILLNYDDVYTERAKKGTTKETKELICEYETKGKYQLKYDKIKRNMANPETRSVAVSQLRDFVNSEEFNPELTDSFGNSALHIAATMPDDSARGLIQKVIDKGVRLDSENITKQNALVSSIKAMRIAQNEEDKTILLSNIKFLLDKGLDVNAPDSNGQTAFHHACATTSVALLTMILSKEPNIFMKDNLGHKGNFYLSTPQMKEVYTNYVN